MKNLKCIILFTLVNCGGSGSTTGPTGDPLTFFLAGLRLPNVEGNNSAGSAESVGGGSNCTQPAPVSSYSLEYTPTDPASPLPESSANSDPISPIANETDFNTPTGSNSSSGLDSPLETHEQSNISCTPPGFNGSEGISISHPSVLNSRGTGSAIGDTSLTSDRVRNAKRVRQKSHNNNSINSSTDRGSPRVRRNMAKKRRTQGNNKSTELGSPRPKRTVAQRSCNIEINIITECIGKNKDKLNKLKSFLETALHKRAQKLICELTQIRGRLKCLLALNESAQEFRLASNRNERQKELKQKSNKLKIELDGIIQQLESISIMRKINKLAQMPNSLPVDTENGDLKRVRDIIAKEIDQLKEEQLVQKRIRLFRAFEIAVPIEQGIKLIRDRLKKLNNPNNQCEIEKIKKDIEYIEDKINLPKEIKHKIELKNFDWNGMEDGELNEIEIIESIVGEYEKLHTQVNDLAGVRRETEYYLISSNEDSSSDHGSDDKGSTSNSKDSLHALHALDWSTVKGEAVPLDGGGRVVGVGEEGKGEGQVQPKVSRQARRLAKRQAEKRAEKQKRAEARAKRAAEAAEATAQAKEKRAADAAQAKAKREAAGPKKRSGGGKRGQYNPGNATIEGAPQAHSVDTKAPGIIAMENGVPEEPLLLDGEKVSDNKSIDLPLPDSDNKAMNDQDNKSRLVPLAKSRLVPLVAAALAAAGGGVEGSRPWEVPVNGAGNAARVANNAARGADDAAVGRGGRRRRGNRGRGGAPAAAGGPALALAPAAAPGGAVAADAAGGAAPVVAAGGAPAADADGPAAGGAVAADAAPAAPVVAAGGAAAEALVGRGSRRRRGRGGAAEAQIEAVRRVFSRQGQVILVPAAARAAARAEADAREAREAVDGGIALQLTPAVMEFATNLYRDRGIEGCLRWLEANMRHHNINEVYLLDFNRAPIYFFSRRQGQVILGAPAAARAEADAREAREAARAEAREAREAEAEARIEAVRRANQGVAAAREAREAARAEAEAREAEAEAEARIEAVRRANQGVAAAREAREAARAEAEAREAAAPAAPAAPAAAGGAPAAAADAADAAAGRALAADVGPAGGAPAAVVPAPGPGPVLLAPPVYPAQDIVSVTNAVNNNTITVVHKSKPVVIQSKPVATESTIPVIVPAPGVSKSMNWNNFIGTLPLKDDYYSIFRPAAAVKNIKRKYWDILGMSPFQRLVSPKNVVKPEDIANPVTPESPVDKPRVTESRTIDISEQNNAQQNNRELSSYEVIA